MGFEKVFDNRAFKPVVSLRKKIQFLVNYVLSFYFWMATIIEG